MGVCHDFESGDAALISFEKALKEGQTYHLVTLDISMPNIDGLEVLNHLRQIEDVYNVPEAKRAKIIMVTSRNERDSILSAISERCTDYIVKPFNRAEIFDRLSKNGIIP